MMDAAIAHAVRTLAFYSRSIIPNHYVGIMFNASGPLGLPIILAANPSHHCLGLALYRTAHAKYRSPGKVCLDENNRPLSLNMIIPLLKNIASTGLSLRQRKS